MTDTTNTAIAKSAARAEADIWRKWMRTWDVVFYGALTIGAFIAIRESFRDVDDGLLIAGVATASAVWYGYFGSARKLWAKGTAWAAAFLAVEAALWLALMFFNPIFIFAGFGMVAHVCRAGTGWIYVVAAIIGGGMVLQEVTEPEKYAPINWEVLVNAGFIAGFLVIISRLVDDIARRSAKQQRLIAELETTRAELAAAEREAGTLAERHRLARDIHDTLAQGFTSIVMLLEAAEAELENRSTKAKQHIDQARMTARDSLTEARSLVWALRSERLLGNTVDDAIESLVDEFRAQTSHEAEFARIGKPRPMPPDSEECLLRVAQEALANVRKHAAASHVEVTLSYLDDQVVLELRDDGIGFEPASLAGTEGFRSGVGLQAMAERVEELGGTRRIESGRGEGTAIVVELPLVASFDRDSTTALGAS